MKRLKFKDGCLRGKIKLKDGGCMTRSKSNDNHQNDKTKFNGGHLNNLIIIKDDLLNDKKMAAFKNIIKYYFESVCMIVELVDV